MMATALLRTSRSYKSSHFFKYLVASSKLPYLKRLTILKHKLHKALILINIPVAFRFSIVNTALFLS